MDEIQQKIETFSDEISDELSLSPRDRLYIKNVLTKLSCEILKMMTEDERNRTQEILGRSR